MPRAGATSLSASRSGLTAKSRPDVRARAPGRGAWIEVGRAALDEANAKGKLKAALQRAFKQQAVDVPADLGARTDAALRQAVLDRLGMEARAGNLVTGGERIEAAARAGKVSLLIHAADAGDDGSRRLDQAFGSAAQPTAVSRRGCISPRGALSCRWRWAAKMWYISP